MKNDATSRILKNVHNSAKMLHRVGALDDRTMRKFDALCLTDVAKRRLADSPGLGRPPTKRD